MSTRVVKQLRYTHMLAARASEGLKARWIQYSNRKPAERLEAGTMGSGLTKGSICDISFVYPPKLEVYATLTADMKELSEIEGERNNE